jgi:hypothetical protein
VPEWDTTVSLPQETLQWCTTQLKQMQFNPYNTRLQALEEREAPFDTFCQLYNVVYKRVGHTSESVIQASRSPHQLHAPISSLCTMPLHHTYKTPPDEADISLALSSLNASQIESTQCAATIISVPKSTLINQRARKPARHNCQPNSKKLTQQEEQVIVSYILNLD